MKESREGVPHTVKITFGTMYLATENTALRPGRIDVVIDIGEAN